MTAAKAESTLLTYVAAEVEDPDPAGARPTKITSIHVCEIGDGSYQIHKYAPETPYGTLT